VKSITIISLGWLGKQLHQDLLPLYQNVSGSYLSTPKGLENEFLYDFTKEIIPIELESSDTIILNLPPTLMLSPTNLTHFIKNIKGKRIILVSSISVYGNQGDVNEETTPLPSSKRGRLMLDFEKVLEEQCTNYLIIRSAGQYGKERQPGKFLSGKKDILGGETPVNLISRDDLITTIIKALDDTKRKVINAVNTNHPKKNEFYTEYCQENKLELPHFKNEHLDETKTVSTLYEEYKISSSLF